MKKRTSSSTLAKSAQKISKLLVCNRGEIAIRIFRACTELGIKTVALYTHEDRFSLHRYKADEAYQIGAAGSPVRSYLDIDAIVAIAKSCGADAVHPGYGFLSERIELREAVVKAGLLFVGPDSKTLDIAGDKVKTLALARSLKVPTVPGSGKLASVEDAAAFAKSAGYPVIIKASYGGGGRGMRVVRAAKDLSNAFSTASNEAGSAFGRSEVYLEKYIERPKHIEVQLLGDGKGGIVHLFERDCSLQRRHQKVIEVAPATTLAPKTKAKLYEYALKLGKALKLKAAATAEFLVDDKGGIYFIEINPRIQVEHTVTEEITGVDLIQSQIKITEGASLTTLRLTQKDITSHGVAIQCRVTTEDPADNFKPDCGKLVAYRSASGFGIRLDAGSAFTGAVISPYYDSLLVKVTARGRSIDDASRKLRRCLHEFRIRGVKTNLQFLDILLSNPHFLNGTTRTTFIEENPKLFDFVPRRDRANKLLKFVAEVTVNGHELMPALARPSCSPTVSVPSVPLEFGKNPPKGWRDILKKKGVKDFTKAVRAEKSLLITDTTFRDAHQSLVATRLRTKDMLEVARSLSFLGSNLFSLEMWGGATFDVCLRFLREDPWERLALLREAIPNIPFQMLIRGANVVGYKNYPDNVVKEFIKESAHTGIDIFRIFDCFNNISQMRPAIDAVKASGGIAEACLCYTGDVTSEESARESGKDSKFDLRYYTTLAKNLVKAGADIIAIKDMAGLLRPPAATLLIKALREEVDVPLHLHTHDTAGGQIATYLNAAAADVDVVDCAFSSMSGVTSQPCLEGLVAALENTPRDTKLSLSSLTQFGEYWETVRSWYAPFESDLKASTGEVYLTEIPGGQYSNFRPQAASMNLGDRWGEVKKAYIEVNKLLGGVVKVTPSSKVIGDFALFMVANNLTIDDVVNRAEELNFPASVIELFQGQLGIPYGGLPESLRSRILRGAPVKKDATGSKLPSADFKDAIERASECLGGLPATKRDALSYLLYPHVFKEYGQSVQSFGDPSILPTLTYLYGLKENEEIAVDIEAGKRLYISLSTISEPGEHGERTVFFELNGQTRTMVVRDRKIAPKTSGAEKAVAGNDKQVGAPLAGALVTMAVKPGQTVEKGTHLCTIEAMKMQTIITAQCPGKVERIIAKVGSRVDIQDLLIELK